MAHPRHAGAQLHAARGQRSRRRRLDPAQGTTRERGDFTLQEVFLEYHLFDWNARYGFASVEVGLLPFRSDFRGFLFVDTNLGIPFFGNADQNKWQYNVALFDQLDKDTNSGLVRYEDREQNVFVANVYRQDWPVRGYTTSLSLHWNRDTRRIEFDDNAFLVAPAPIGNFTSNEVDAYYLGWAGEGHLGRWNITHALYRAMGFPRPLSAVTGGFEVLAHLEFEG